MAKLVLFIVSLAFVLFRQGWCQPCDFEFLEEPSTVAGSPIMCNILDARVELTCKIRGTSFSIVWFHTKERNMAGVGTDTINNDAPGVSIQESSTFQDATSTLILNNFDSSSHGFYWCKVNEALNVGAQDRFPSQVVEIVAPFTLDQLKSCEHSVIMSSPRAVIRCAVGLTAPSVSIVAGAEFTNIAPTTQRHTTTTRPIHATTTTEHIEATTEEHTEATTESGNNVARMAVIWFSVGAAAFILIAVVVVICAVAIAKC